jgi:hypothetical protein
MFVVNAMMMSPFFILNSLLYREANWRITFRRTTQWFLVLRKISIAQSQITKRHQKPLSDDNNPYQLTERRGAAC